MATQYGNSTAQAAISGGNARTLPREIYALRRSRDAIFPRLFGDPAWDIVLYLYECHRDGWPATRGAASDASRTAAAVGARFLKALIYEGLVRPALGSEETHVELTEEGLAMMECWLVEVASMIERCTSRST